MFAEIFNKYRFWFLLVMGLHFSLNAQSLLHTRYSNLAPDHQPKMASFNDGSLLTAYTHIGTTARVVLLKTDACGDLAWSKEVTTPYKMERLLDIRVHNNEVYLAAVMGRAYPDSLLLVSKLDASGQSQWSEIIYQNRARMYWYSFDVNQNGEIFLNGNTNDPNSNSNVIIKLNPQGQIIWSNAYSQVQIWGMGTATTDGGFLKITGRTIYKLSATGNLDWAYRYSSHYQSQINPIETTSGYLVFSSFIGGIDRCQVFKLDFSGQVTWSSNIIMNTHAAGGCINGNGEIFICDDGAGPLGNQLQLLRLTPQGQFEESLLFDGTNDVKYLSAINNNLQGTTHIASRSNINGAAGLSIIAVKTPSQIQGACQPQSFVPTFQSGPVTIDPNRPSIAPQSINFLNDPIPITLRAVTLNSSLICSSNTIDTVDVELGPDTVICPGEIITLFPKNTVSGNYKWSTGERTTSIEVSTPGTYWLEIEAPCQNIRERDSLRVDYFPDPNVYLEEVAQPWRLGDMLTLSLKGAGVNQVIWQVNNDTIYGGNPCKINFETPGKKHIKACLTTAEGCLFCDSTVIFTEGPKLQMPDAFTPNGDGLNDFFGPPPGLLHHYDLEIYDRLGKRLIRLENQPWAGTIKDEAVNGGVYLYFLHYRLYEGSEEHILRGYLTLLR